MSYQKDIPTLIRSPNATAEKRITPSWTFWHFKTKMESVTGIPPDAMRCVLKVPGREARVLDDGEREMWDLGLVEGAEIEIEDTRPPAQRNLLNLNLTDPSSSAASVEKYTMPAETYATLPDTVLAWKKANKLGRFDPHAPEIVEQKISQQWETIHNRKIKVGARCRLVDGGGGDGDGRRGTVAYVGPVPEIPLGVKEAPWVGVVLDEPVGKNDGCPVQGGKRYFECKAKCGVFVRGERVEVGDWGVLADEELNMDDEDEEEEI